MLLPTIHQLPQDVVNQIAAGEVVERPAHLVKELIENSLDAGATEIELHFSEGGRFVQIRDDGYGIKSSELHLALLPHSTSKINSSADLWKVNSYGFRGEALASMAAVSDLTLISKPVNQKEGASLRSQFGQTEKLSSMSALNGTTVIVKNLFQNIPARMKFLKSEASETTAIKNVLKALALSSPHIRFRILNKNRLLFYWPKAKNLQERAKQVLSLENSFYTKSKYMDVHIEAVFCPPNHVAHNRRQMWFFVGGRWVSEDSTLYSAVLLAYRSLLMQGEYPIIVLNLNCRPEDLDVNVHPAKSKVRFKNSSLVFKAVQQSLRSVLEGTPWLKMDHSKKKMQTEKALTFPEQKFFTQTQFHKKKSFSNFTPSPSFERKDSSLASAIKGMKMELSGEVPNGQERTMNPSKQGSEVRDIEVGESKDLHASESGASKKNYWSSLDILCQAHSTYLIVQSSQAIIFIDQHAAHERVLYERLMRSWKKGESDVQNRLIPLVVNLDESLADGIFSVKDELSKIGLLMERSGPDSLVIHSSPCLLKDSAIQKVLTQLGEEMKSQGGSFAIEKKVSDLCATLSCHSAIRAGQVMGPGEIKELLVQMDEFALGSFCPHGRPVFVEYPLSRLERDFGRRI